MHTAHWSSPQSPAHGHGPAAAWKPRHCRVPARGPLCPVLEHLSSGSGRPAAQPPALPPPVPWHVPGLCPVLLQAGGGNWGGF